MSRRFDAMWALLMLLISDAGGAIFGSVPPADRHHDSPVRAARWCPRRQQQLAGWNGQRGKEKAPTGFGGVGLAEW
jgi:hypothetical protein